MITLAGKDGFEVGRLVRIAIREYERSDDYANVDDCFTYLRSKFTDIDDYYESVEQHILNIFYPEYVSNPGTIKRRVNQ